MDRKAFETALLELRALAEMDATTQDFYQQWFERHPVVFDSYGYKSFIAKPQLTENSVVLFVPDFLVQRLDGLWEVFEIKRPDTSILKDASRRQTFYASLESYYAQCRDYSQYFDDSAHRKEFRERYGIEVQKSPAAVLVAGRNDGLDKSKVHQLLFDRGSKVLLQTYDDVAERLEFFRAKQFGKYEYLPGISAHMMLTLFQMPGDKENFVLDVGTAADANRVSIYLNKKGDLCLEVLDSEGISRVTHARQADRSFQYGEPTYLMFEVGVGEDHSILSTDINGRVHSYLTLERQKLDLQIPLHYVLGSDVFGTAETHMHLAEMCVYDHTLSFREKVDLSDHFFYKYRNGFSKYVEFVGNQFLHSEDHPNFTH